MRAGRRRHRAALIGVKGRCTTKVGPVGDLIHTRPARDQRMGFGGPAVFGQGLKAGGVAANAAFTVVAACYAVQTTHQHI